MRRVALFAALAGAIVALAAGCNGCQHPTPPLATVAGWDGGAVDYSPPDGPASCLDVCRNGQHLGCSWAVPTPGGVPCVDVCANAQAGPAPFDLDCRARATSCAALDRCN